jgi:hypothetical protein
MRVILRVTVELAGDPLRQSPRGVHPVSAVFSIRGTCQRFNKNKKVETEKGFKVKKTSSA